MKKLFVFLLVTVIAAICLFSEEYDIRKLKWGMSFEQVQEIEGLSSDFYKSENILGIRVEVLFGCDNKGLYSVTYSSVDRLFGQEARKVLINKYGEPKSDLDYSYLLKVKDVLKDHPVLVIQFLDTGDLSELKNFDDMDTATADKKVLRIALSKRDMWEFGNTVALLVDTVEGSALSYWSKNYHIENKKLFEEFVKELRKNAKMPEKKKKASEGDKF